MSKTQIAPGISVEHSADLTVSGEMPASALPQGRGVIVRGAVLPDEFAAILIETGFKLAARIELSPARSGLRSLAGGTNRIDVDVALDESVALLLESDGVFAWKLPDQPDEMVVRRGPGARTVSFLLPSSAGQAAERRGMALDWIVDTLIAPVRAYVLKFTADATIELAVQRLEGDKPTGLVPIVSADPTVWKPQLPLDTTKLSRQNPHILLLLHGTFSSTRGSFGQLSAHAAGQNFLAEIGKSYDAVLGFDHPTLSESPEANAAALQVALEGLDLADGATFDTIAYSRGGLVYRAWAEQTLPAATRPWSLGKAVFVACTNNGTHLADPTNWSSMIDLYTNITLAGARALETLGPVGSVSGFIVNETVKTVGRFAQILAQQALTEDQLPGLAAMRPDSGLITLLNSAVGGQNSLARYVTVSSKFAAQLENGKGYGEMLGKFLLDRISRRLFKTDNDLVVDTSSMTHFGSRQVQYNAGDSLEFGATDDVYHTIYFSQEKLAQYLTRQLAGTKPEELITADREPRPVSRNFSRGPFSPRSIPRDEPSQQPQEPETETVAAADPTLCNFAAEMPSYPFLGEDSTLAVVLSRETIEMALGATAQKAAVVVNPSVEIMVEVIALANCRVIGPVRQGCPVPRPGEPTPLNFKVRGIGSGAADLLVEARQGVNLLVSFALKPVFIEKAAERLSVSASASVGPTGTSARRLIMRIYETEFDSQISLKFNLDCEDPNINLSEVTTLRHGFSRDVFVTQRYNEIEKAWIADPSDYRKFMGRLRASGIAMADSLLPLAVRQSLWDHRAQISAIQVISDEPFIPWELLFLADPEGMQREREGFLAEFGLVRWLHNTPWPSRRLAVGTGKLFYVIPDYPVTQYVLKGAETERERLSDMFVAAPVDPDSDSVTDFLAAPPEDCAILHFACHGDARQEAVLSADLMMRGRVREGHYQPDLLSADMVGVSARFAKTTSPVVFLNACRVGQNGMTIAGAGGFAQSFLKPKSRQGAGVFVGCLWSIGDQPASTFASTFYRSLTERATLVDAAKAAREAAKSAGEFTWLAYSVYGDPMARAAE